MMRGRLIHRTWSSDPALYAPPRYRRACAYDAFVPDPVAGLELDLPGAVVAVVSEAEAAIAGLNRETRPELAPLARLLLRTESIASSKVEGLQVGSRSLARAEAMEATGRRIGAEAAEVIGNIDAMQFAIEEAVERCDRGEGPREPGLDRRQRLQPLWGNLRPPAGGSDRGAPRRPGRVL